MNSSCLGFAVNGAALYRGFPVATPLRARDQKGSMSGRRTTLKALVSSPPPPPATETKTTAPKKRRGPAPKLHLEGDELSNTPEHVALVTAGMAATMAVIAVYSPAWAQTPITSLIVFAASQIFSDFASGVYHWAVDNYGNKDTPIFGTQIAAFQGHHSSPWTICQRGFFNNISKATVPALPQMIALAVLPLPPLFSLFYGTFLVSVVMAQEAHKWAHMIEPPPGTKRLQNAGLLISRKVHGLHHSEPFEGNYCIWTGLCNPLVDRAQLFRRMEVFFFERNGIEPNCWKFDPKLGETSRANFGSRKV